jgi:TPP-dependent pyruvate/acetoin dehydrogenase alpha subunit
MVATEVGKDKLLKMYRTMQTIRQFEERLRELFKDGKVPGFVHVSIGEEASATGACATLTDKDYITSTHRGHGHLLAKGGKLRPMMAELFGKKTGYCKGKGGSMHIADFSIGILGANGIVGAGLPIATGAALAAKIRGSNEVAVCFFGDGASNEGVFHESLNIASSWKLPVVYVCENNLYGEFTAGKDVTSVKDIADRARGHDMPGVIVNGNDVVEVYETTLQAVERARRGEGPTLIECKTYRWEGHVVGEEAFLGKRAYRPQDEIEEWKKRCPLISFEKRFTANNMVTQAELDAVKAEVKSAIEDAVQFAVDSPLPAPEEALEDMFSAA